MEPGAGIKFASLFYYLSPRLDIGMKVRLPGGSILFARCVSEGLCSWRRFMEEGTVFQILASVGVIRLL